MCCFWREERKDKDTFLTQNTSDFETGMEMLSCVLSLYYSIKGAIRSSRQEEPRIDELPLW